MVHFFLGQAANAAQSKRDVNYDACDSFLISPFDFYRTISVTTFSYRFTCDDGDMFVFELLAKKLTGR